jgi:uncharacterized protein involved in oxidation of intracellular sulfur
VTFLFILNDEPYASERDYNALRLATELAENAEHTVRIFLLGEGVRAAAAGHRVPEGMHDIEWMLSRHLAGGHEVLACGTCMGARGLTDESLIEGARRGTLAGLAEWTAAAERVLVF